MDKKPRSSISESFRNLRAALQSLNRLMPALSVVITVLFAGFVAICLLSIKLMMAFITLLVVLTSIIIYVRGQNYGEAALALVAGLLAVYTVEWNAMKFIAFSTTWIFFTIMIILIYSVRLAAKTEETLKRSAIALQPNDVSRTEKKLHEISNKAQHGILDPVERAESIQIMAYRKMPLYLIQPSLETVGKLATITGLNHRELTRYLTSFYNMIDSSPQKSLESFSSKLYGLIKDSPIAPHDVISTFEKTKYLVVSRRTSINEYIGFLNEGFNKGLINNDMETFLLSKV